MHTVFCENFLNLDEWPQSIGYVDHLVSQGMGKNPIEEQAMVSIHQLKYAVNHMAIEEVSEAVSELLLEGLVTEGKTPFSRTHFNVCFAEIEALMQRAGYHRPLDVVGYQGQAYAMFDPSRWDAVEVLRWLKEYVEEAKATSTA